MASQYPARLTAQSGSLVPPPDGVSWRFVPSEAANPIVLGRGFGSIVPGGPTGVMTAAPSALLSTAESLFAAFPWYVWAGLGLGVWFYFREQPRHRAPRALSPAPPPAPVNPRRRHHRR